MKQSGWYIFFMVIGFSGLALLGFFLIDARASFQVWVFFLLVLWGFVGLIALVRFLIDVSKRERPGD